MTTSVEENVVAPSPCARRNAYVSSRGGGLEGSDCRRRRAGRRRRWLTRAAPRPSVSRLRARKGQVDPCCQTCDTPAHMRGKSFEFSGLSLASAGHVRGRLSPARIDQTHRAAAHTCLLSGRAPMPSRMSALVLNSRCIKSRWDRSRGGFQHLQNNFLYVRTDPSCTLE